MKVLFVSSGNKKNGISPIVKNQGDSLKSQCLELDYFAIKGKGYFGYFKNIFKLHNYLKCNKFDIVHAHYSDSAIVASLAGAKPLVVSLMGSDVKVNKCYRLILLVFKHLFWVSTIVKSKDMSNSFKNVEVKIIPNGVDFNKFIPMDNYECKQYLGWEVNKQHILFAADRKRPEKNYRLALDAYNMLDKEQVELHSLNAVINEKMPYYYNAADVVLLTSLWEGSPNVIKEAMACNRPIVATDVGDIKNVISFTTGCFICKNNADDIYKKLLIVLNEYRHTSGRKDISHLESSVIAIKLIDLYEEVIKKYN